MKAIYEPKEDVAIEATVKLAHWWPARPWHVQLEGREVVDIGPFTPNELARFKNGRLKYVTKAFVELRPYMVLAAFSECSKGDQPERWEGRARALGRLVRILESLGIAVSMTGEESEKYHAEQEALTERNTRRESQS